MTVRPSNVIPTDSLNQCCIVISQPNTDPCPMPLIDPIVIHVTRTFPDPESLEQSSIFRFWHDMFAPEWEVTALMVTPAVCETV